VRDRAQVKHKPPWGLSVDGGELVVGQRGAGNLALLEATIAGPSLLGVIEARGLLGVMVVRMARQTAQHLAVVLAAGHSLELLAGQGIEVGAAVVLVVLVLLVVLLALQVAVMAVMVAVTTLTEHGHHRQNLLLANHTPLLVQAVAGVLAGIGVEGHGAAGAQVVLPAARDVVVKELTAVVQQRAVLELALPLLPVAGALVVRVDHVHLLQRSLGSLGLHSDGLTAVLQAIMLSPPAMMAGMVLGELVALGLGQGLNLGARLAFLVGTHHDGGAQQHQRADHEGHAHLWDDSIWPVG